ncbi:hypothetical protein BCV69DRAFT_296907 [Microstroma glucosiphilum]|uniref:NADH2 dehydrogenase n=1 Tax=Pseudomicrostroma glucosiphilum TaxID=1684307 RepID=A0A316UCM7_9BASI|nr:hypothetical protein BCV69DRAFT_296907 [Pseudomicrostroma glucosiphilum]PWN22939.1 hypothetical protein BCV69DRAFT_296907 [Pseudomicrostroma glucosiphilum]
MFRTLVRRAASSTVQVGRSAGTSAPSTVRSRISTHITGLDVHPAPLSALKETYESTLSLLKTHPENSVYRQATEAITNHRLAVLQSIQGAEAKEAKSSDSEEAIAKFEEQIDEGLAEEVLSQAQHEMGLAAKMLDWQPSEALEHPAPPGQWVYFNMKDEQETQ